MDSMNRRQFTTSAIAASVAAATARLARAQPTLPFHVGVINDEISPDFEHACHVAAVDLGLHYIELRSMWGKNVTELDDTQVAEAKRILASYKLTVTDIASPLYKVEFPGGKSAPGQKVDQFGGNVTFARQDELLERCIHLAHSFGTTRIRCFDFVRLADPRPFLPEIRNQLRRAATRLAKENMVLLLENEHTCNTATGAESAATLAAVTNTNFMLNWDPGNAAAAGEVPFPNGYDLLPKNRIGHCHCKDELRDAEGKPQWAAVGAGSIDWRGQLQALVRQNFTGALSLETHWRGPGGAEASTRESMAGLQKILATLG